jgi:hypothetical protein
MACTNRLSHCSRGEDEGEGFKRTRPKSTLTLPPLPSKWRGDPKVHRNARISELT